MSKEFASSVPDPPEPEQPVVRVNLKAKNYTDNRNGTITIEVPARPITEEEQRMLEDLFPNLQDSVHKLLSQEALFGCVASTADMMKPADGNSRRKY